MGVPGLWFGALHCSLEWGTLSSGLPGMTDGRVPDNARLMPPVPGPALGFCLQTTPPSSSSQIHEVTFDRTGTFTGLHKAMALKGHGARVLALAFSPDLARAATASADGTLRLWDLNVRYALREDPRCLSTTQLPRPLDPGAAARLAWGPCGVLALAAGPGLAFFDEAGGRLLAEIPAAHARPLAALAWAPARLTALDRPCWVLATAAADGRVRLWRAPDRAPAGRRLV